MPNPVNGGVKKCSLRFEGVIFNYSAGLALVCPNTPLQDESITTALLLIVQDMYWYC